ncbi:MAG: hypothetical protein JWO78_27 [Micavibrio sp.]|nr:hypothetical protein [Micavibrio sp.]
MTTLSKRTLLASLFTTLALSGSAQSEFETLRAQLYTHLAASPGQDLDAAYCAAHHIAGRQLKAEQIIRTLNNEKSDQRISATERKIEEMMPGEALTIMMACNEGQMNPPSLIFNMGPV